jgi:hypothetical protein
MPFELELAAGNNELIWRSRAADFGGRKTVPAVHRLSVNASQVLGDIPDGRRLSLKPMKLAVVGVSNRLSLEYG